MSFPIPTLDDIGQPALAARLDALIDWLADIPPEPDPGPETTDEAGDP